MARVGSSSTFALLSTGGRTYTITPSSYSINEGSGVTFTINTFSVPDGTVLYWTTSGTVSGSDFSDGLTTGSVTINSGTASITRTTVEDALSEGTETFAIQLRTESITGEIVTTSSDISIINKLYVITPAASSVDEGYGLDFTVTTTNVPNTTLYWTINHGTTVDADFSAVSGSFTITSGSGTFQVATIADETTEGVQTFTVSVRITSISGIVVATSDTISLLDTSVTPATGQAEYFAYGIHQWVCPPLVFSVSAVCVGGGGGSYSGGGGGGGGLAYGNNIPVVPGNSYTVQVGFGGFQSGGSAGQESYFISGSALQGGGGGTGGFNISGWIKGGGGGAGGYTGNGGPGAVYGTPKTNYPATGGTSSGTYRSGGGTGGKGGSETNNSTQGATAYSVYGNAGTGGAGGGGGGCNTSSSNTGVGGGVGLYGATGVSGLGGYGSTSVAGSGGNGSTYTPPTGSIAVYCGAGARGAGGNGGHGGVRLIWPGNHRSFPSTRAGYEGDPIFMFTPPAVVAEGTGSTTIFSIYAYYNATYYWTIHNVTTTSSDWTGGVAPSGTLTVGSNTLASIQFTPAVRAGNQGDRTFYFEIRTDSTSGPVIWDSSSTPTTLIDSDQAVFTTAGSYTWTAPEGVTSVSVVAVGGGGGGGANYAGGAGGGLGYKNNITVVPGQTYTVVVGDYGRSPNQGSTNGGNSYFINTTTVVGYGGKWGATTSPPPAGGSFVGDGGGTGGDGGLGGGGTSSGPLGNYWGAGGGAGGYSGAGGDGGGYSGSGGGGGGGGSGVNTTAWGGGGGGVGLYGQGSNGVGAPFSSYHGGGGSGGSGDPTSSGVYNPTGGAYGGGGGGASVASGLGRGGIGAVRIIWPGNIRQFPSTGAGNF